MRCLLSGNDFCGRPEAMGCQAHGDVRLISLTYSTSYPSEKRRGGRRQCGNVLCRGALLTYVSCR